MATLLIDNYDSYTFNLYQLLARVEGEEPVVVRNDELEWSVLAAQPWDRIVVSPGPGRPERARDLGVCARALAQDAVPVLGVCLGHQGLGHVHGAGVVASADIVHGRISRIYHHGAGLFNGIPQGFRAVRYHSLVVEAALPPELEAIAWSDDGTVMAIHVRGQRSWGVQFHPESIGTEHGERLVSNFVALTAPRTRRAARHELRTTAVPGGRAPLCAGGAARVRHRELDGTPDPESAFAELFGDREHAFWLDSSLVDAQPSRFSFMGAALGELGAEVRYSVGERRVTVTRGGVERTHDETIFAYLSRELARLHSVCPELPFDFNGGFVGYLGYELKADCGARDAHRAELPDAFLLLADRVVAIDHVLGRTHLLALTASTASSASSGAAGDADAERWLDATATALAQLETPAPRVADDPVDAVVAPPAIEFELARGREHYMANVEACKRLLEAGESYEICLTNRIALAPPRDAFALYRVLRRVNPAPYGAYLRLREGVVLSSSPERFLRVRRDRSVETKPIKGTARRIADPDADARARDGLRESAKDRAEHLMIVDLLRNDLGRVSQIGSVYVAKLMDVESYETVHQLVSTIRGLLRDDVDIPDCIRATFPGGSMTGAPKLRTMEIIDGLEGAPRGVYSGALGYLALNGTADLAVVIRTLVATAQGASIGSGGAVVMLSEAEAEYEEMLLKAQPLLDAASICAAAARPAPVAGVSDR
ncbi:MAG TPA: aminodeoxychorismate synthase component I [Solirubrobacteraceae bacterium]|nr:aminodeoxychorismate synthase component I [Solirubrobacteraceae bacterium]